MADACFALLENRGIVTIAGEDAVPFLQGLVSNDVTKVSAERAIHAAFLTPQGKYLHDFFIFRPGEMLALDCEASRAADLVRRLSLYRLRSKVEINESRADFTVAAAFEVDALAVLGLPREAGRAVSFAGGIAFVDPRLGEAGARVVLPRDNAHAALAGAGLAEVSFADYDAHRLALGLPDGSRDLIPEKTILLEAGFEELDGVDFAKGCYLGQELTARTKYRGLIKRRLVPVAFDDPPPPPETPILSADGRTAGETRSTCGNLGLALLRLEYLTDENKTALTSGEARLHPRKPAWAAF